MQISNYIVNTLLEGEIQPTVVVYSGRFQPFHKGHYAAYRRLVHIFGEANVYIATSNKTDDVTSPLTFQEKHDIITTMFGVPSKRVMEIKNPYSPKEILETQSENTIYITAIGNKDSERLVKSPYYHEYKADDTHKAFNECGYYFVIPPEDEVLSGTEIRNFFREDIESVDKENGFIDFYGKFNRRIYELLNNKLNSVQFLNKAKLSEAIEHIDVPTLLKEASATGGESAVDDGPGFVYRDYQSFISHSAERAEKLGYSAINYILDADNFQSTADYPRYPDGPVGDVSYGPKGIVPLHGDDNERPERTLASRVDTFTAWNKHISKFAKALGWEIINYLGAKEIVNASDAILSIMAHDIESNFDDLDLTEGLILEGAAYGHMNHPFDDMNLTFDDMKNIINSSLDGNIGVMMEKTDGQNIMISWKNGKVIAARNKSHLKNYGENALDTDGLKSLFKGRGILYDAFSLAIDDIASALSKLSEDALKSLFEEGKKFASMEIIYPSTTNVIPYNTNLLVFHGTVEYDESGTAVGMSSEDSGKIVDIIKKANADVQKTFTLRSQPVVDLPKSKSFDENKSKYLSQLRKLQQKFKLKGSDVVAKYHQEWWADFIRKQAKKQRVTLSESALTGLIRRWAFSDKKYTMANLKKEVDNEAFVKWATQFDKKNHKQQVKKNIEPFETIFLNVGADLLTNIEPVLAVHPDKSVATMQQSIKSAISDIRKSKDTTKINKLRDELARLRRVGGFDRLVPVEGLVFTYKGNIYKLTGVFPVINRILGLMRY